MAMTTIDADFIAPEPRRSWLAEFAPAALTILSKMAWLGVILAALASAGMVALSFLTGLSAPQQGALCAAAAVVAIAPYVVARAIDELARSK
jgi:hypothetical protein